MGTRGYVAFKLAGIYYIFYNNSDSYTSGLGNLVLKQLKKIIKSEKLLYVKELISKIPKRDSFNDGDLHFPGIIDSLSYPSTCQYTTSTEAPDNTVFIEWIYLIDFDKNQFIVKNYESGIKYNFDKLPDDINEYEFMEFNPLLDIDNQEETE